VSGAVTRGSLPVDHRLLGATDDQYDVLSRWVAEVASPGGSLLEIGAGDGDDVYFDLIRPLVGNVVAVDPDGGGVKHSGLDTWLQMSIEEFSQEFTRRRAVPVPDGNGSVPPEPTAEWQADPFDLALAVYVVEHVSEPAPFFSAIRACLRPGGSLFVITPNLWHYFGVMAKAAMALGLEDRLLGFLRAAQGGHEHAAHFSVAYRANSVRALRRLGAQTGYSALEVRHLENPALFETYFPGRSVAFPRAYSRVVHRVGRPALYGTLICRLVN